MIRTPRWHSCIAIIAACVSVALIAWAYWPGLSGPFLFDDYSNLDVLGAYGPIGHWPALLYYLSSGGADPTGRPVALLTFLLDATTWPAEAWPFKRTNLILHLLNTALLGLAVARLQAALQRKRPDLAISPWTPTCAAALWGAHPFFVSTTLYVVQREAMLPMTFVLLALLAWDRAMLQFARQLNSRGWAWAILGTGGATLLAGLSKANGFLAPLLVGVAYLWCLRPVMPSQQLRRMDGAALLCLGVPSLLVLGYLAQQGWTQWALPLPGRDWTLPQRLLSEPRALWTYVSRLMLPRSGGGGIYVDGFNPSRSWLGPASTLPAALALGASLVGAVALRRRLPILSFAWLFFLAGHVLESTTIALELYFEHRNYLPAAFMGWPLAHALLRPGAYSRYRTAFAVLLLAALLLLTRQRAVVWGDSALLGTLSAAQQGDSARAQVNAAQQRIDRGDLRGGLALIRAVQHSKPTSVDIAISAIAMECDATGALTEDTMTRTRYALQTARGWNYGIYDWLRSAASDVGLRRCRNFGLPGLTALVTAAEANPQSASPRRKRDLWHTRGQIALAAGDPGAALRWFDAALQLEPDPEYVLVQAAALGDAGAPALGVQLLDRYARMDSSAPAIGLRDMGGVHAWLLAHYGYHRQELSHLRQQLQEDANSIAARTGH